MSISRPRGGGGEWSKRFERQEIDFDRSPAYIHKSRRGGWLVAKTIGAKDKGMT